MARDALGMLERCLSRGERPNLALAVLESTGELQRAWLRTRAPRRMAKILAFQGAAFSAGIAWALAKKIAKESDPRERKLLSLIAHSGEGEADLERLRAYHHIKAGQKPTARRAALSACAVAVWNYQNQQFCSPGWTDVIRDASWACLDEAIRLCGLDRSRRNGLPTPGAIAKEIRRLYPRCPSISSFPAGLSD